MDGHGTTGKRTHGVDRLQTQASLLAFSSTTPSSTSCNEANLKQATTEETPSSEGPVTLNFVSRALKCHGTDARLCEKLTTCEREHCRGEDSLVTSPRKAVDKLRNTGSSGSAEISHCRCRGRHRGGRDIPRRSAYVNDADQPKDQ